MNDLVKSGENGVAQRFETKWTKEQEQLVKDTVCRGASDDELKLFMYVCKKTGLDPFVRQIHSVARWDGKLCREVRTTQTAIDGFRVIADRSGKYNGQLGPFWCGEDGKWVEVWLSDENPKAAKIGILRTDFKEPIWSVALWDNYCPMIRDKQTGKTGPSKFWKSMGPLMLAKVAECLSLRRAFPQDLSGIYSDDEMAYADAEAENEPKTPEVLPPKEDPAKLQAEKEAKDFAIQELKDLCSKATKGMTPKDKGAWMAQVLKVKNFDEILKLNIQQISDKGADVIKKMNIQNENQS